MLSFVLSSLAIAAGTLLALAALHVATRRFMNVAPSGVLLSGRLGAAAMILPGFWLSVFIGAPLFGGIAIGLQASVPSGLARYLAWPRLSSFAWRSVESRAHC